MSDPIFVNDFPFLYFTCDRDPTSSESIVTLNTGSIAGLFFWWNQTSNNLFFNTQNVENDLLWHNLNGTSIEAAANIADVANNATNNLPTNYDASTSLVALATALNASNAAQNDLATKYNDLATKLNTLFSHLEAQGLQLPAQKKPIQPAKPTLSKSL
jgi:hypothetical protein